MIIFPEETALRGRIKGSFDDLPLAKPSPGRTERKWDCLFKTRSQMRIGIPKEIKPVERRIFTTPACVKVLPDHNHEVFVEREAGKGSDFPDEVYRGSGARILDNAEAVWLRRK